jgi:hypothetical protein
LIIHFFNKIMETVSPEPGNSALDSKHELAKEETNGKILVQDDGALKDSTEAELTKISLMRTLVESRDPSSKVTNKVNKHHHDMTSSYVVLIKTVITVKLCHFFCNYNLCHILALCSRLVYFGVNYYVVPIWICFSL